MYIGRILKYTLTLDRDPWIHITIIMPYVSRQPANPAVINLHTAVKLFTHSTLSEMQEDAAPQEARRGCHHLYTNEQLCAQGGRRTQAVSWT